jgi:hypothetical protein
MTVKEVFAQVRVRNVSAAIEFYTRAFGAIESFRRPSLAGASVTWSSTSTGTSSCFPMSIRRSAAWAHNRSAGRRSRFTSR